MYHATNNALIIAIDGLVHEKMARFDNIKINFQKITMDSIASNRKNEIGDVWLKHQCCAEYE